MGSFVVGYSGGGNRAGGNTAGGNIWFRRFGFDTNNNDTTPCIQDAVELYISVFGYKFLFDSAGILTDGIIKNRNTNIDIIFSFITYSFR
jgi:hypothetical protein